MIPVRHCVPRVCFWCLVLAVISLSWYTLFCKVCTHKLDVSLGCFCVYCHTFPALGGHRGKQYAACLASPRVCSSFVSRVLLKCFVLRAGVHQTIKMILYVPCVLLLVM